MLTECKDYEQLRSRLHQILEGISNKAVARDEIARQLYKLICGYEDELKHQKEEIDRLKKQVKNLKGKKRQSDLFSHA